jgi:hypothetical protein
MHDDNFYDQTLKLIERGQARVAIPLMVGKLYQSFMAPGTWTPEREALHRHPLHAVLMQDPSAARAACKPRGYAGDAVLIDMIYDQRPPVEPSPVGREIFDACTAFQGAEGVRKRRDHAEKVLKLAVAANKRVCVMACGHLREADQLIGQDLTSIVAVDQDPLSLQAVREKHGENIHLVEANVFSFLRSAMDDAKPFDLIYTLGLTDYLDARAMRLLHKMVYGCLAPGGSFLLANFVPNHLSVGWMDAVMDWHLITRDEAELETYAREVGFSPRSWRDETGSIAWCEMLKI